MMSFVNFIDDFVTNRLISELRRKNLTHEWRCLMIMSTWYVFSFILIFMFSSSRDDRNFSNIWFFSDFWTYALKFLRISFFDFDELKSFMKFESSLSFESVIFFNKVSHLNRSTSIIMTILSTEFCVTTIISFSLIRREMFMKFFSLILAAIFMKSFSLIVAAIFMKFIDWSLFAAIFEAKFLISFCSVMKVLIVICESLSMKCKIIEFKCKIRAWVINSSFEDE